MKAKASWKVFPALTVGMTVKVHGARIGKVLKVASDGTRAFVGFDSGGTTWVTGCALKPVAP